MIMVSGNGKGMGTCCLNDDAALYPRVALNMAGRLVASFLTDKSLWPWEGVNE